MKRFAPIIAVLSFSAPAFAQEANLEMTQKQAAPFAKLALKGIQKEYPNKPGHVLNGGTTSRGRGPCIRPSTAASTGIPRSTATGCWSACCGRFPNLPERQADPRRAAAST